MLILDLVFHSQAIANKLTYELTEYFTLPISQHYFPAFHYIIEKRWGNAERAMGLSSLSM